MPPKGCQANTWKGCRGFKCDCSQGEGDYRSLLLHRKVLQSVCAQEKGDYTHNVENLARRGSSCSMLWTWLTYQAVFSTWAPNFKIKLTSPQGMTIFHSSKKTRWTILFCTTTDTEKKKFNGGLSGGICILLCSANQAAD